jgi:protocatechuate 4,5-dioxygenase beta chain
MFVPPERWHVRYEQRTRHTPQPPEAGEENLEVLQDYSRRIEKGFAELRERLAAYRPDVLIMVSDDQNEVFDRHAFMPTMAIYLGEEVSGTRGLEFLGKDSPQDRICLKTNSRFSEFLAEGLMERGFDLACVRQLKPMGNPQTGLSHGFTRTAPKLMPDLDVPVVLIFLNCYYPPLPSARRCFDLGRALRELLDERPERVAIYGSGGLSHDPTGPRVGWIDKPLDRFILDSLANGKPEKLLGLYTFDSDTVRGGTGEVRNWLVAAGAMGSRRAAIVDYIPAHHAVTGLGFAYWPCEEGK